MRKHLSKLLALTLCFCLLLSGGILSSGALPAAVTDEAWDAIWADINTTQSNIAAAPGSNPTERNFAWQSGKSGKPTVVLAQNEALENAVVFTGTQAQSILTKVYTNYVTVKDLAPNTTYYYKCVDAQKESPVYSFTTQGTDAFKAILFSDIHIKDDESATPKGTARVWNDVLETVIAREGEPAFLMSAGDNANYGLVSEYLGLYAPPVLKSIPLATTIGNHDKKEFNYRFYQNNPNPYKSIAGSLTGDEYWYRYGDALFLVMDTTSGSAIDHQNFVKKACEANPDAKWRIVMYHHDLHASPYSKTGEDNILRLMFDPIMYLYDIDMVFSGHSHLYVRSHQLEAGEIVQDTTGLKELKDPKGTTYIGSSSINHVAGTDAVNDNPEAVVSYFEREMLYNVISMDSSKLSVKVCRVSDGEAVDEITIEKSPENMPKTIERDIVDTYTVVEMLTLIYAGIDRIVRLADIISRLFAA